MRVGLFIPCYIDQCYPRVGIATVEILERLGIEYDYPEQQTCCGQPMANTGCSEDTRPVAEKFFRIFRDYEYVVCPSGSCVSMIREHYDEFLFGCAGFERLKSKTFELCEFLHDVLHLHAAEEFPLATSFPHRVGVHQSCHGLRGLRTGSCSEVMGPRFSKIHGLLERIDGISFVELSRVDECCGFGGTFAVQEEAVSVMMGRDRIRDHASAGAEVITAADMSCLMHMQGIIRRENQPLQIMHVAEILAGHPLPAGKHDQGATGQAAASIP